MIKIASIFFKKPKLTSVNEGKSILHVGHTITHNEMVPLKKLKNNSFIFLASRHIF